MDPIVLLAMAALNETVFAEEPPARQMRAAAALAGQPSPRPRNAGADPVAREIVETVLREEGWAGLPPAGIARAAGGP